MSKPRLQRDWHAADWSLTDSELGRLLKCSADAVSRRRHELGKPPSPGSSRRRHIVRGSPLQSAAVDWSQVDWSQTNKTLASQLGCTAKTVNLNRKRQNAPPSAPRYEKIADSRFVTVDWSLSNRELAARLSLSHSTIARYRLRLGRPNEFTHVHQRSQAQVKHMKNTAARANWRRKQAAARRARYNWTRIHWQYSNDAIAVAIGCHKSTVAAARLKHGRPREKARNSYDFSDIDWTHTSVREAAKLKHCSFTAARQARLRSLGQHDKLKQQQRSAWNRRKNKLKKPALSDPATTTPPPSPSPPPKDGNANGWRPTNAPAKTGTTSPTTSSMPPPSLKREST